MFGAREARPSSARRTRVLLTLAGVVVALLAPLAPAQAAAPTIVLSRGSVIGGESINIGGNIGQKKARSVVLQRQSGKVWVKITTSRTTAAGAYKFLYKPPTKVGTKTVVRVIAPAVKIGKTKYKQITSGGRSVLTIAQTASMTSPDNVAQGAAFTVTGKFTPARTGRTVVVQKLVGSSWVGIGKQSLETSSGTVEILGVSFATTGAVQTRLIALAADGAPAFASAAKTITVFLAAPTGLQATAGNSSVHLSWNAVSGAQYNVYQSTDPNFTAPTKITSSPITPTQYDANGLSNGVKYYFAVTSVHGSDESAFSVTANATPVAPPDTTPPPVPTNVHATAGNASAQVTWSAVTANDLQGYKVYQRVGAAGDWVPLTNSPITGTSYGASGLTNGTHYFFAVKSVDTSGNPSDFSAVSEEVVPAPGADTTPPPIPTGVQASAGNSSAQVSWTAVSAVDLQGYNVYKSSSSSGPWGTPLNASPITDLTYQATGLTNGTQVFFAVSSVDTSGNVSNQSTSAGATPAAPPAGWASVTAGRRHTCAIATNGSLYCWGYNYYGQLGNDTGIETGNAYVSPVRVGGSTSWTNVSAGDDFTCGVQAPGTLWCWGLNKYGQLGNDTSTTNPTPTPTQVGSATNWASVSAGADHACAVTTGHTVFCWGLNTDGELGRTAGKDTLDPNPTPAQVGTDTNWAAVSSGDGHTCATKTDNTAYCWGSNLYGQLGSSTNSGMGASNTTPLKVTGSDLWSSVSAGGYTTCGVTTTKGLKCWGRNQFGQLAKTVDADGANATPVAVTGTTWTQVAVGGGQVCALKTDNAAYCWGRRDFGQGGATSTTPSTTPTKIGTGTTYTAIVAGGGVDDDFATGTGHTVALTSDSKLFSWGANLFAQLGRAGGTDTQTLGTTNPSPTPGVVLSPT